MKTREDFTKNGFPQWRSDEGVKVQMITEADYLAIQTDAHNSALREAAEVALLFTSKALGNDGNHVAWQANDAACERINATILFLITNPTETDKP